MRRAGFFYRGFRGGTGRWGIYSLRLRLVVLGARLGSGSPLGYRLSLLQRGIRRRIVMLLRRSGLVGL